MNSLHGRISYRRLTVFFLALLVFGIGFDVALNLLGVSSPWAPVLALSLGAIPLASMIDLRMGKTPTAVLLVPVLLFIGLYWWFIVSTLNAVARQVGDGAVLWVAPPLASGAGFVLCVLVPVTSLFVFRQILVLRLDRA